VGGVKVFGEGRMYYGRLREEGGRSERGEILLLGQKKVKRLFVGESWILRTKFPKQRERVGNREKRGGYVFVGGN